MAPVWVGFVGPIVGIVGKIGEFLMAPVGRHFGYLFSYKSKVKNLKEEVEKLDEKRGAMQLSVDEAERNVKVIGPDVKGWLGRVDKCSQEAREILKDEVEANKGCLYGVMLCFPGKAAGVRIAGQGAPIEAAPAKKGCEREVSEAANGVSDELKSERIIRLSWALVHSKQPEDMQHGIAMLEALLANSGSPLQKREKLYLLAVGYYRSGEYRRSRQLAEQCLEISPDWMQALTLKKTLDDQITKDGLIGIGITATVVGLVAGGIAASLG